MTSIRLLIKRIFERGNPQYTEPDTVVCESYTYNFPDAQQIERLRNGNYLITQIVANDTPNNRVLLEDLIGLWGQLGWSLLPINYSCGWISMRAHKRKEV